MNRNDALVAIRSSVSRGSITPSFSEPREAYLARKAAELEAAVIDPIEATVVGETFNYGAAEALRNERVFAIASSGDKWLLYRPTKGEFSLAYGPDPGLLKIWGFLSSDALAEWLG